MANFNLKLNENKSLNLDPCTYCPSRVPRWFLETQVPPNASQSAQKDDDRAQDTGIRT